MKQGVPPHYCQVEGKVQVPYSSSVDIWWQKWDGGDSLLLLGMVGFPDTHVVSTDTTVSGGGLIPTGQWLDTTPILQGKKEERYIITAR